MKLASIKKLAAKRRNAKNPVSKPSKNPYGGVGIGDRDGKSSDSNGGSAGSDGGGDGGGGGE